jgi:hypothetical protein
LGACGSAASETELATHAARAPAANAPSAIPALGDIRWIEVGTPVRDVSVSPERVAAVLEDGSIVTFDLASGARSTTRPADMAAPPTMPSLSPDGHLLAHCVGDELSVIDVSHDTYGNFAHEAPCSAPALWSPDSTRVYAILEGGKIHAFDVATAGSLGEADILVDAFVTPDGDIVSEGEHRIIVLDRALAPITSYTMPVLDAQHGSAGVSFLLAAIDHTTFVYACGVSSYDVELVHDGARQNLLWTSAQHERWEAVFPLANETTLVLGERDDHAFARIVNARTGQAVIEIPDMTRPFDVSADGAVAVGALADRIAVIGLR